VNNRKTKPGATPGASCAARAATQVALPLSNWASLATNPFGASGAFSFTNRVAPGDRQRFFRLRTPETGKH
jgi:hypothetical protein